MKVVSPEQVGFSAARLERIGHLMQHYVAEQKLAGAMTLIARHGQIAHWQCFGRRDVAANKPIESDTIFRIYSMTKPITSTAAMMLYEQGHFLLDDPLARFMPEFEDVKVYEKDGLGSYELVKPKRPIRIKDLLRHTAGFTYGIYGEDNPVEAMYKESELLKPTLNLKEFIYRLSQLPLAHHPGQRWTYSVATDVVAYLVELVSGMPFAQYLAENIFGPLEMVDSGFYVPVEKAGRFAQLYGPREGGGIEVVHDLRLRDFLTPPPLTSGGGGLVSTMADYFKFAQMLLNQGEFNGVRLLGRKTVEMMRQNHIAEALMPLKMGADVMGGYGFGLGFGVIVDAKRSGALGSDGILTWGGLASTHFWIDPQEDLLAILMTQLMPSGYYPLHLQFRTSTYQALVG
jgi:CubicO group peptidase (beta-lactamase class C family)